MSIDKADAVPNPEDRATAQYQRVGAQKVTIDATGGRSIVETVNSEPNAADGVATLLSQGAKGCWVITMGVNDAANIAVGSQVGAADRISRIMDKLQGQDVLWPTVVTTNPSNDAYSRSNMDKFNAALKAAAGRYQNLKVFDFEAQDKPEWHADDGIHYTSAGTVARNRLIADALAADFPAAAPAPAPMPTNVPAADTAANSADDAPAWGSIRVPIALAAARTQSTDLGKVTAAIADSDSAAATDLWKGLGANPGKSVTAVLNELGATNTKVIGGADATYDDLAHTAWPVADQAAFGAGLLCAPDRSLVTSAMMQAPASEAGRWGLQTASGKPGVQFVAAHGGWGPVGTSSYSARQFGLVQTAKGLMSVSISGLADTQSRDDAVKIVNAATDWLTKNLAATPAGFCNPSDRPTTSPDVSSTPSSSTADSSTSTSSAETSTPETSTPETSIPVVAGADPSETTSADPSPSTTNSAPEPSVTSTPAATTTTPAPAPAPAPKSVTTLAAPNSTCTKTVIALDPGHNGDSIEPFDPVTGAKMVDYPNGAEDTDVFTVAKLVAQKLGTAGGYEVILLKDSPTASISYRDRVTRAEKAGAVMGVSIHTSPGDHSVFPQRVGLYREGPTVDGSTKRIEFTDAATASRSALYSGKFAQARSAKEGVTVQVRDNSFSGRAPLWSGNIPIISLISTKVPWVYNEFGPASGGGGANKIADSDLQAYADGLADAIRASAPGRTCG